MRNMYEHICVFPSAVTLSYKKQKQTDRIPVDAILLAMNS